MQVYAMLAALAALCMLQASPVRADDDSQDLPPFRELRQRPQLLTAAKPQAPFFLPADAANKGGVFGADVSHWDFDCGCSGCSIDWAGALWDQGIRFIYAEATVGNASLDKTFASTWLALKPLHENGRMYRGAFHWLSSDPQMDGASQAQWFLQHVEDGGAHLPHALDFEPDVVKQVTEDEYNAISKVAVCKTKTVVQDGQKVTNYLCDGWYGQSAEAVVAKIKAWLKGVDSNSQKAMIYTTANFWNTMVGVNGEDILSSHGVWLARYLDPATFPDKGKPQSVPQTNRWWMPQLPNGISYPAGSNYTSPTNWQFEQCGQFHQTVWTCNGKPTPGPVWDKNACPMATSAVMDMSWYPSSITDFKAAFGLP